MGTSSASLSKAYPEYENSGYTRQIVWIDTTEYRVQQIEFYDRKDSQLKTLTYHGYNEYLGQYWRPSELRMVNHQTGKSTDLFFNNWKFQTGQQEAKFTAGPTQAGALRLAVHSLLALALLFAGRSAEAAFPFDWGLTGEISAEVRSFPREPLYDEQEPRDGLPVHSFGARAPRPNGTTGWIA